MSDLKGVNILVTGSTTGLGLHTARALFNKGASVIVTCRDEVRGRRALESIVGPSSEDSAKEHSRVHLYSLDMCNYHSIINFCEEVKRDFESLHVIINNAGVMSVPFELSPDGIELHFATNVFGHFVVVSRLLPLLIKSSSEQFRSRIIVVSSGLYKNAHAIPQASKLLGEKHWDYDSRQAYAFSKLANCLYTVALDKLLQQNKADVGVYCVRPGFVRGTELGRETHWILRAIVSPVIWMVSKNLDQGIETMVYLAETDASQLTSGKMYYEKKEEEYTDMVNTASVRQLWATLCYIEELILKRNHNLTDQEKEEAQNCRRVLAVDVVAADHVN